MKRITDTDLEVLRAQLLCIDTVLDPQRHEPAAVPPDPDHAALKRPWIVLLAYDPLGTCWAHVLEADEMEASFVGEEDPQAPGRHILHTRVVREKFSLTGKTPLFAEASHISFMLR